MDLYTLMGNLKALGAIDILLPFLLFYAIILGILKTAAGDFLGGNKESLSKIISFALSAFIIVFTPFGLTMGSYLIQLFGGSSTIIVGLLVLILITSMVGIDISSKNSILNDYKGSMMLIALVIGAIIWFAAGPGASGGLGSETILTIILIGAVIYLVIWGTKETKPEEPEEEKKKKAAAAEKEKAARAAQDTNTQ